VQQREEELEEDGAKFARHPDVNEEANSGVEKREKVHEVAEWEIDLKCGNG
jgi:hypothetical protein